MQLIKMIVDGFIKHPEKSAERNKLIVTRRDPVPIEFEDELWESDR